MTVRSIALAIARRLGSRIVDFRTGQDLGRALLVPYRGKIHVIGLTRPVMPIFLPQARLTYWKQEIGFATHPEPDFPHEPSA